MLVRRAIASTVTTDQEAMEMEGECGLAAVYSILRNGEEDSI